MINKLYKRCNVRARLIDRNKITLLLTISRKTRIVGDSGMSVKKFFPSSQHLAINGSNGNDPKKSIFKSAAIARPPPVNAGKISEEF